LFPLELEEDPVELDPEVEEDLVVLLDVKEDEVVELEVD